MDINKHIYNYLKEYQLVVVPRLGRFVLVDKPSKILDGGIVAPPVKTVEYDSEKSEDDGALTAYIAQQENISVEQAQTELIDFYSKFERTTIGKGVFTIDRLGVLSLDDYFNIVFEPDADLFIEREDSYGLERVDLQSEAGTTPEENTSAKSNTNDGSLFEPGEKQFRENTNRRRPAHQQEPAAKPADRTKPDHSNKGTAKKTTTANRIEDSRFPMWVVWILAVAVALGVGGYLAYPKLSPYVESMIASIKGDKKPTSPEVTPSVSTETEEETPDPEVAQTLDNVTNKKNALNPAVSDSSTQQNKASQTKPATTQSQPATTVAHTQGSVGKGKYLLIIGSFTTRTSAEKYGKVLQKASINYEIIDAGEGRFRISVASFDDKTEAFNHAAQLKSKRYCEDVWVARR